MHSSQHERLSSRRAFAVLAAPDLSPHEKCCTNHVMQSLAYSDFLGKSGRRSSVARKIDVERYDIAGKSALVTVWLVVRKRVVLSLQRYRYWVVTPPLALTIRSPRL
eukprot:6469722-Amphidinium_carterae.2